MRDIDWSGNTVRNWLRNEHDIAVTAHAGKRIEEMEIPLEAVIDLAVKPDLRYSSRSGHDNDGFVHFNNRWPRWALVAKQENGKTVVISAVFRELAQYAREGVTYEATR